MQVERHRLENAVYFDFEGRPFHRASILGVLWLDSQTDELWMQRWMTNPTLAPRQTPHPVNALTHDFEIEPCTLESAIFQMIEIAEDGDRSIASYSQYDLHHIERHASYVFDSARDRFVNAKDPLVRWWTQVEGCRRPPGGYRLQFFLEKLGYEVPPEMRSGVTGTFIRDIEQSLDRGIEGWNPEFLNQWEILLGHNKHDLIGLRTVVLEADRLTIEG